MTDDDKERAKDSLKEKRDIDIDTARISVRIEFGDKTSKLARETLDAIREQGVALVNLGADRFVPAANITGAEEFSRDDAERLKGEDYTLNQTFRAKVETKAGGSKAKPTDQDTRATTQAVLGLAGTTLAKISNKGAAHSSPTISC